MPTKKDPFKALIGKKIKLIVKEPDRPTQTIYCTLKAVGDYHVIFKTDSGTGSFNLKNVVAIKPVKVEL